MSREAWSRYWQYGHLHSCAGAFSDNYSGRALGAWLSWFELIPENAVLVDIGTGNGALPALAKQYAVSNGKTFQLHGVDFASIEPLRTVADGQDLLDGIRFHSNTSAAALPFEAASVDAVSAQFALEYMDIPAVLQELRRVTKPGAFLQFVMHHKDSVFVATGRYEFDAGEVLQRSRFIEKAETLFSQLLVPGEEQNKERIEQARLELNSAADSLADLANKTDVLSNIDTAFQGVSSIWQQRESLGAEGIRKALGELKAATSAHHSRLADLLAAARSREQMIELAKSMQSTGYDSVQFTELRHENGSLLGWVLRARAA